MTVRTKLHFALQSQTWQDLSGDTYDYAILKQAGFDVIPEGTVGKKYVVRIGGSTKLDAPSPPFQTDEAGDWRD